MFLRACGPRSGGNIGGRRRWDACSQSSVVSRSGGCGVRHNRIFRIQKINRLVRRKKYYLEPKQHLSSFLSSPSHSGWSSSDRLAFCLIILPFVWACFLRTGKPGPGVSVELTLMWQVAGTGFVVGLSRKVGDHY